MSEAISVAVIPAAGRSTRMGRSKAELPYRGATVIEATLRALGRGGVDQACVVLAPGSTLRDTLPGDGFIRTRENPEPERGMLSSVVEGLLELGGARSLAQRGAVLVVCPVDFPALRGSTVAAVIQAIENGAELAVPVHAGRRGHPLAICPRLIPAIPELDLEVGLRQLLDHHAAAVVEVAVEDPGIHLNVNTPEDYRRLP